MHFKAFICRRKERIKKIDCFEISFLISQRTEKLNNLQEKKKLMPKRISWYFKTFFFINIFLRFWFLIKKKNTHTHNKKTNIDYIWDRERDICTYILEELGLLNIFSKIRTNEEFINAVVKKSHKPRKRRRKEQ